MTMSMTEIPIEKLQQIARVCHEANRAFALTTGEDPAQIWGPWADVSDEIHQSAMSGVGVALGGVTPEDQHVAWCASKRADGWTSGPVRDNAAKIHPCLVAYEDLPEPQRRKDALFQAIVRVLA